MTKIDRLIVAVLDSPKYCVCHSLGKITRDSSSILAPTDSQSADAQGTREQLLEIWSIVFLGEYRDNGHLFRLRWTKWIVDLAEFKDFVFVRRILYRHAWATLHKKCFCRENLRTGKWKKMIKIMSLFELRIIDMKMFWFSKI